MPIDARLIRGDERRPQIRITRFGFEFVFLPFGIAGNNRVVGALENDLVTFLPDGAECAVGVNEAKPIEGRVHHLSFRNEIGDGRDAQIDDQERQSDGDGVVDARRLRFLRRTFCALNDRPWKNSPKEGVIKTSEKRNNRHIIQKGEVAADDENDLKTYQQDAGDMACAPRTEGKPGDNQFNKMIPSRAEFVEPMRREMQIPTNRAWDRLRFVMIIKTGKIAPTWITA